MRRVFSISVATVKSWMRSRSGVFFSLLFPVMLLLIFASVFGRSGGSEFILYVQNFDTTSEGVPTELSGTFIKVLNETGAFDLKNVPAGLDGRIYVQDRLGTFGGTFRLLIIPPGFQSDILNSSLRSRLGVVMTTAKVFVERAGGFIPSEQKSSIAEGLKQLERAMEQFPAKNVTLVYVADPSNTDSSVVQSIIDNLARGFNYRVIGVQASVKVDQEPVAERRFRGIDYYLPGLIGAFIMTNGVIGVASTTTDLKRRGVLKRLATTPLTRLEWIMGNIFSQTFLSFLLVGVMISVAWAFFGLQAIPDPLTLITVVTGAVMFSGIGLILAGVITDVEAASAAGNAIAFPMMFLSGSFWPIEIMPSYLQSVAQVLPLTYFTNGLRSALIYHHIPSALTNLGIVALLALLFILVGSLVTKWKEL